MFKMIAGLFIGVAVTAALFLGPLSPPTATAADSIDPNQPELTTDNTTIRNDILFLLQEAGNEIQNNDTEQFYQKLIQGYELTETSDTESQDVTDILPDIKKISNTALSLPLQEAGKNIRDEEIARFYHELLESLGWQVEPD